MGNCKQVLHPISYIDRKVLKSPKELSLSVISPALASELNYEAIAQAINGRMGPVLVDIPLDIQAAEVA